MFQFGKKPQPVANAPTFLCPPPDPFENPMVETLPANLQQWIEHLPIADTVNLGETVLTALSQFNRYPGQIKKRRELLDLYQAPIGRFYQSTTEREESIPLDLRRALMREMAYGYLRIVNEQLGTNRSSRQPMLLLQAIYQAVKHLAFEHYFSTLVYDCRWSDLSSEMIRLHTLAEELGIQDSLVEDEELKPTITHLIKRSLLLMLAGPCHFRTGEAKLARTYLDHIASAAFFEPIGSAGEPSGCYVIDRTGKTAPYLYKPDKRDELTEPRHCLFNLTPVSAQVHQHLRIIENRLSERPIGLANLPKEAASSLLKRLLKSWHVRQNRGSERHAISGNAFILFGIQAIYRHLISVTDNLEPPQASEDNIALVHGLGGFHQPTYNLIQAIECQRMNQSHTGIALRLGLAPDRSPQIGELVLVLRNGKGLPSDYRLGQVKRAMRESRTTMELGIEFIQGKLNPISLQPQVAEEGEYLPSIPALYIGQSGSQRGMLIAAKKQLELDQVYKVAEDMPASAITLTHRLEVMSGCERFNVKPV